VELNVGCAALANASPKNQTIDKGPTVDKAVLKLTVLNIVFMPLAAF
jgi:hypothetical protein